VRDGDGRVELAIPITLTMRIPRNRRALIREDAMRKLCLTLIAALAVACAIIGGRAQAAVVDANALRATADQLAGVEQVQFIWRGRKYCWYDAGWHGPGWYWCGYRWRRGFGWGGPIGWHGWRKPVVRHRTHRRPSAHRPGRPGAGRPGHNRPGAGRPGHNRPGANRPGGNRPGANRPGGNRPGANRPGGGNRPGANRPGGQRPGGGGGGGGRNRGGSAN
jgi:hypothetical protein